MICKSCFVCQLIGTPDENKIFNKYAHFSSASKDNVNHLKKLSLFIKKKFPKHKNILEVGCNDGTLLKFLNKKKFNAEGVDPAKNFRTIHKKNHLKVYYKHFGLSFINKDNIAFYDLIVGVNVFAHFKKISQAFTAIAKILKPQGKFIFEVAYAVPTLFSGNYDTIYHEHVFNHTITGLENLLSRSNLHIQYAKKINTQGGSLRIVAIKNSFNKNNKQNNYFNLLKEEKKIGINKIIFYKNFSQKLYKHINEINDEIKKFAKSGKKKCLLVGTPARGVIFSNTTYVTKLKKTILDCVDDTNAKVNKFFPGLNIRVQNWEFINKNIKNYDKAILLSWNYKSTMIKKLKKVNFKGQMLTFFPVKNYKIFS